MGRTMLKLSVGRSRFPHRSPRGRHRVARGHAARRTGGAHPMFLRVRERLAGLAGVTAVSAINHLPLAGDLWNLGYTIDGRPVPAAGDRLVRRLSHRSAGLLRVDGASAAAGPGLLDRRQRPAPHVAIVNQAMADRRWPGESPSAGASAPRHQSTCRRRSRSSAWPERASVRLDRCAGRRGLPGAMRSARQSSAWRR